MTLIKKHPFMNTTDQQKKMQQVTSRKQVGEEEEEDIPLPGFRFHPTDEELVGFYLRRMVDKKPLHIDLIKQIDIYKYDPWDLPQACSDLGSKEWYFFCRRGRKYRNSIRPNRVTGSGFWKATGIDRPIYSTTAELVCIGLKKSLVYYRGSAGKGTKTEWMMHEFRLPPTNSFKDNIDHHAKTINHMDMDDDDHKSISQEAEVWTLCRILKKNGSHKKTLPSTAATRNNSVVDHVSSSNSRYISFQTPINIIQINGHEKNPFYHHDQQLLHQNHLITTNIIDHMNNLTTSSAPSASSPCFSDPDVNVNDITHEHGDWDDLRSLVEFASADDRPVFFM